MAEKHPELTNENVANVEAYEVNVDPKEIQMVENERSITGSRINEVVDHLNKLDRKFLEEPILAKKINIIRIKKFYLNEEKQLRERYKYYSNWLAHLGKFKGGRRRTRRRHRKTRTTRRRR